MALAKFGQYESALKEFDGLLKGGIMPLVAAKNIIRCHLALSPTVLVGLALTSHAYAAAPAVCSNLNRG